MLNKGSTGDSIRLFFAIALSAPAKLALETACEAWRKSLPFASWHHPADFHVTVKFIGDVHPRLADELLPPVREAVSVIAPFELALAELGAFGRPDSPSVLWCGVSGETESLQALHAAADAAAAACGVPRDTRTFRPHITVARRYRGVEAPFSGATLAKAASARPIAWRVQELVLYRTRFGHRPAYEALAQLPLEGGR
ncbi:RNA 2',3'-cyclic phosphodiesterase [Paenibacillus alkalitolerans]|uniref:RNA 2',3'-cyclic phosphodiesterase n=1 Tax=Paenibacillus alkalitolerans TaxID=2799335 RepID=UPI0018F307DE|nr:RNA 2',3'-cyclic phosphodiesterase [Paenibacillus alkalitolerans]